MFKVDANLKEIATRQLTQRRARREGEPQRPVTTVKSKALHGLQFRAMVEGHNFISDESDEAGGHDAGPAPLRYFLGGIMMCHQVWCVKSAAVADVQIGWVIKARAEVLEKEANKELRYKSSGPRNGNGPFYSPVRSSAEIDVSS